MSGETGAEEEPRVGERAAYTAPALEKGLDIIELLAAMQAPLSARQIGEHLGRSKNEIFRMVVVLEERGYLQRDPATDQLMLTNKLFELGMRTPWPRQLVEVAIPAMERLSDAIGHSSHLVVVNKGETVVVGSAVGRSDIKFTLQLGYRRPAADAASGQTIMAFQTPALRRRMIEESLAVSGAAAGGDKSARDGAALDRAGLDRLLDGIAATGSFISDSREVVGVTDICGPILDRGGRAIASLVVPCLSLIGRPPQHEAVRSALLATCEEISELLL